MSRKDARLLYGIVAGAVVAATSVATALLAALGGASRVVWVLAGLVALPIGAFYAARIARLVVTRIARPATPRLARLATDGAVPHQWRTLVVLPAIVATPERARELLHRLARLAHEHDDPNVRFALLADFADAPTRTAGIDAEILAEEQRLVERINAELRDRAGDRVFVLHRERRWYRADRTWIGWERKRGKLLELHRLLLGGSDTSYRWTFGDLAAQLETGEFPYVFTLDDGNWLPRGQLLAVLRVAAHPANRARLDPETGRLVHGYAIFQPAVVPASAGHDGAPSLTPLAASQQPAAMRFYFDVLDAGIFQGKGLLDVRACDALLRDVFPPGEVLQHDVLEGFVARTAALHDAFILEAQAPGYLAQVQRGHRWLRGYFQMTRWVLPRMRGANGAPGANPLCGIHRLFVLELVLPEVARPASLVLLVAGWLLLRDHAVAWTILVCPPLALLLWRLGATTLPAIIEAVHRRVHRAPRAGRPAWLLKSLAVDAFATVIAQATLPYEALIVSDALGRAVWRMLVSRRHLLDWPVMDRLQSTHDAAHRQYRGVLRPCCVTGVLVLASVALVQPVHLLLALPFAASWISAPSLVAWLDGALLDPEPQVVAAVTDIRMSEPGAKPSVA
jgi:cyclic beta-1,2-glucan synthetase